MNLFLPIVRRLMIALAVIALMIFAVPLAPAASAPEPDLTEGAAGVVPEPPIGSLAAALLVILLVHRMRR